jgi:hypothetical protein
VVQVVHVVGLAVAVAEVDIIGLNQDHVDQLVDLVELE